MIISKILSHIKNGTVFSRIFNHGQIETEKRWRKFYADQSKNFIIKKLNPNSRIKLAKNNLISKAIYNNTFEAIELNYLKRSLKGGQTFIDIGANIGLFSIVAATLVGKKGMVLSFEPTPQTYEQLNENIKLNNFNNVLTYNYALSDKNEKLLIEINEDENSALNSICQIANNNPTREVDGISLDTFIENNRELKKIDLIKIDVEGWEYPVVNGMQRCLKDLRPNLMIELNENNLKNKRFKIQSLFEILTRYGYNLFEFDEHGNLIPLEERDYYTYMNIIAKYDQGQD